MTRWDVVRMIFVFDTKGLAWASVSKPKKTGLSKKKIVCKSYSSNSLQQLNRVYTLCDDVRNLGRT